jgi:hypothetical protein
MGDVTGDVMRDAMPPRVRVEIGRLVLDGVAPRDVPAIRAAFERELHALVLADANALANVPSRRVRGTSARCAAPAVPSPKAVGRALARAVFAGVRRA